MHCERQVNVCQTNVCLSSTIKSSTTGRNNLYIPEYIKSLCLLILCGECDNFIVTFGRRIGKECKLNKWKGAKPQTY